MNKTESDKELGGDALLDAESTLARLSDKMSDEYDILKQDRHWPQEWMKLHPLWHLYYSLFYRTNPA